MLPRAFSPRAAAVKIAGRHRFARVLSRRRQCILAASEPRNDERPRGEMPRRKARGISEIYTGHKRREGVVKVFRCTPLRTARTCESVRRSLANPVAYEGGILRVLRVPRDSMGARSASLLSRPSFLPFLRAIGRYHCQNGNGPIKIPNRYYGRSFVVPYGDRDKKRVVETADHIRRSIVRSAINSCSRGRWGCAPR